MIEEAAAAAPGARRSRRGRDRRRQQLPPRRARTRSRHPRHRQCTRCATARSRGSTTIRADRDEASVPGRARRAARRRARATAICSPLAIEAARARATLGEISPALEDVFGRYGTVPTPVKGVYGGAYDGDPRWAQAASTASARSTRRLGRKPAHARRQDGPGRPRPRRQCRRLGLRRSGLRGASPGPLFQTPEEAAALALESDVDVVGASSLAAGHKTLIPELIGQLRDARPRRHQGRRRRRHPGAGLRHSCATPACRRSSAPAPMWSNAAGEVLRLLGHNMPPGSRRLPNDACSPRPRSLLRRDRGRLYATRDDRRRCRLFTRLLCRAHADRANRAHHARNEVQLSTLLSIKTGGCAGGLRLLLAVGARRRSSKLMDADAVLSSGAGQGRGCARFCMGAAWRNPKDATCLAVGRW